MTKEKINGFLTSAYGFPPGEEALAGYAEPLMMAGTEGTLVDMLRSSATIPKKKLAGLKIPQYAIWGEKDSWVPVKEAYRLKRIWPDLVIRIIPQAHHCPMETHFDLCNQYILEALQK